MRSPAARWLALARQLPLSDARWSYSERFISREPNQGWKLHVSATVLSAAKVFARAEPILRKSRVLFKVPCQLEVLKSLNSGNVDFSQVGKFLTVYPSSTDEALKLARDLHRATLGLPGPRIPFDRRYRTSSLVYYRYGVFRSSLDGSPGIIRAPGGKRYRDKRGSGKAVPSWLEDPFQKTCASRPKLRGLIRHQLLVFKAKAQRGKGGVYEAVDLSVLPVRHVILKEGRRHGETNWDGRDGYALVKHEAKVLRRLRRLGLPVPEVLREFSQNGNRYLVLERIAGRPLLAANRVQPSRPSWRRAQKIMERLEHLVSELHAAGWVWRDCKPSHIFLERSTLRLIDFEGACRIGETKLLSWGSPNYIPPSYVGRFSRRAGTLEDDFALGVIAFQFMCGEFPPRNSRRRASSYKRAGCPDFLQRRIEDLLRH